MMSASQRALVWTSLALAAAGFALSLAANVMILRHILSARTAAHANLLFAGNLLVWLPVLFLGAELNPKKDGFLITIRKALRSCPVWVMLALIAVVAYTVWIRILCFSSGAMDPRVISSYAMLFYFTAAAILYSYAQVDWLDAGS